MRTLWFLILLIATVGLSAQQQPIQRNTFTTNLNAVPFKMNSDVLLSNLNSTLLWKFFGGDSNRVARLGDITNTVNASSNLPVSIITNLFVTQEFVSNIFVTNITAGSITVNNITNITEVTSNLFVTNINAVSEFVTNLTVQNITNLTEVTSNLFVTNIFLGGTLSSRVITLPNNGFFDGTNEIYTTNLVANLAVTMTNLSEGTHYFLIVSNPAQYTVTFPNLPTDSWTTRQDGSVPNATTNGWSLYFFLRTGGHTNVLDFGQELVLTNGANITLTTNGNQLVIASAGGGAGSDIWTNDNGFVYLVNVDPSTNVVVLGQNAGVVGTLLNLRDTNQNNSASLYVLKNAGPGTLSWAMQAQNNGPGNIAGATYFGGGSVGIQGLGGGGTGVTNASVGISGYANANAGLQIGTYGEADASGNGNTNVGVLANVLTEGFSGQFTAGYFELFTDGSVDPVLESSVILGDNRVTGLPLLTLRTNNGTTVFKVDGIGDLTKLKSVTYSWPSSQGAAATVLTNDGSGHLGWGAGGGSGGLSGTTNFINLSVQAAKMPSANFPGIDQSWQDSELIYYHTNDANSLQNLSATWQFVIPPDYATNSLSVYLQSTLVATNGPNTSNVIWQVSILRATPGDSTDLHVGSFGTAISGTNTWTASASNTNKMQSVTIDMGTSSLVAPGDLAILKVTRDQTDDTYRNTGSALVGLQIKYTRQ